MINHIKKSFVSESSKETSESAACTDEESDVNKTLEIMIEPLKVFIFERFHSCCSTLHILLSNFRKNWNTYK